MSFATPDSAGSRNCELGIRSIAVANQRRCLIVNSSAARLNRSGQPRYRVRRPEPTLARHCETAEIGLSYNQLRLTPMRLASSMIGVSMFAVLLVAAPARAAMVTWQDSGALTYVSPFGQVFYPGLTVGTPWSLQVTFDPAGPGVHSSLPGAPAGCNIYQSGPTTFTLGAYTYTKPSGQIWTNSNLPGEGCDGPAAPNFNQIQFEWVGAWTQEPGAWNLFGGVLLAGYKDALHQDGTLPTVPSLVPGFTTGLNFYTSFDGNFPTFQDGTFAPTAVPEPGTLGMLGIGLAYGARRIRQRVRRS